MLFRTILLHGVLVPAAFAAGALALCFLGRRLWKKSEPFGGGLAAAAAFCAAFVAVGSWPRWPPVEATQRLFFLVALAGLVSLFAAGRKAAGAWTLRAVFLAALLGLMTEPLLRHSWSTAQAASWLSGLLAGGLVVTWAFSASLGAAGEEGSGKDLLGALLRLVLLGGTAAALGLSESARLAQLLGALACGAAVVEVLALIGRRRPWRAGDGLVFGVILSGLLLAGHLYAGLGPWPAVLLLLGFALLAVPRSRPAWQRFAPLLPLAAALALVVAAFLAKEDDPYAGYGEYSDLEPGAAPAPGGAPTDSLQERWQAQPRDLVRS